MSITGSQKRLLKEVFEDAIHLNTVERDFYTTENEPANQFALEHAKRIEEYEALKRELDI